MDSMSPTPTRKLSQRPRAYLLAAGVLITLAALLYTIENWRGKRAWEECKRELEAKGAVLDWNAFVQARVPDEQNVFKAPKMADWFVGRESRELTSLLSTKSMPPSVQQRYVIADVTVLSPTADIPAGQADVVLRYDHSVISSGSAHTVRSNAPVIPVIQMDDVPLPQAIQRLAALGNIDYVLDAKLSSGQLGFDGKPVLQPRISLRWENVTARQALVALLSNYNLLLIEDPGTGKARISLKEPGTQVYADTTVRAQVREAILKALDQGRNGHLGASAKGCQDFTFFATPLRPIKPARVLLRADQIPGAPEIAEFVFNSLPIDVSRLRVESTGSNSFQVQLSRPMSLSAADYLAWSDQFTNEFQLIRDAVKRPYARMDGGYDRPFEVNIPNFVALRSTAQVLAQRAQCYLLLGDPEQALRELTLIHDLHHFLKGKPIMLVGAMIDVAITGLYLDTIADGTRLQVWQEPQLVALQKQLAEIDLKSAVIESFNTERAAVCYTLETTPMSDIMRMMSSEKKASWHPKRLLQRAIPRGWIYQNMAYVAQRNQEILEALNSTNASVIRQKNEEAVRRIEKEASPTSPYRFFAAIAIPNFVRAAQTTCRNQTLADVGRLACALERYRLAHGNYPETLDALAPQFIDKVPIDVINNQPFKYRRSENDQFLLYSIGWNDQDDDGTAPRFKNGWIEVEKGDWVWGNSTRQ